MKKIAFGIILTLSAIAGISQTMSLSRADLYGKWGFKSADIKMFGPDGKLMMNNAIRGGKNDYYIFKEDGTSVNHIGRVQENGKFRFISDNELVSESGNESARIKIISLTASTCTLVLSQKKDEGSMEMTMVLEKQ